MWNSNQSRVALKSPQANIGDASNASKVRGFTGVNRTTLKSPALSR